MDQTQPIRRGDNKSYENPIKNPLQLKGPTPMHWLIIVPNPGKNIFAKNKTKEQIGPTGLINTVNLSLLTL